MFINPKLVKPKVKGQSDKYSWNIYAWLNKHNKIYNNRIYYVENKEFDIENVSFDKIIFGEKINDGEIIGNTLNMIIHKGIKGESSFCMMKSLGWFNDDILDITDVFMSEYIKLGRCYLFGHGDSWLAYDEDRYTKINKNSRRCNWCGKHETRFIETEKIIKRKELWR